MLESPASTCYRRELPCPPAVLFSSSEGRHLFREALAEGTMESFFPLIEQFSTQDEPAFCGLASLAMVLNTLAIDPKRPWKGPWRWFHEQMLDCCKPLTEILSEGIHLDQAACLARCNGAKVECTHQSEISLPEFQIKVEQACRSSKEHLIVSYSRKALEQTGDGHFSPIGGFHARKKYVLILDVARFKYPPHWVPLQLLYKAMGYEDPATGRARGFLCLGAYKQPSSVLFVLNMQARQAEEAKSFSLKISSYLKVHTLRKTAVLCCSDLPLLQALSRMITVRQLETSLCCRSDVDACFPLASAEQMLAELRSTTAYSHIEEQRPQTDTRQSWLQDELLAEKLCITLFFLQRDDRKENVQGEMAEIDAADSKRQILRAEVDFLALQYAEMLAPKGGTQR